ncbi:MAG: hypothetical protein RDU20_02130 [Desulfomonilaceae bacterium]|nr:hypothetical protein [Desulfomonilaceae bacterium]
MKNPCNAESVRNSIRKGWRSLKDFLYGFFLYGMVQEVEGRRRQRESAFFLLVMGDLVGLPIFPCYYRFRLLPYCIAKLGPWKRNTLRPKDLFSNVSD